MTSRVSRRDRPNGAHCRAHAPERHLSRTVEQVLISVPQERICNAQWSSLSSPFLGNAFTAHSGAGSRLSATRTHSQRTVEQLVVSIPRERVHSAQWASSSSQCHRNAFATHSGASCRLHSQHPCDCRSRSQSLPGCVRSSKLCLHLLWCLLETRFSERARITKAVDMLFVVVSVTLTRLIRSNVWRATTEGSQ